MSEGGFFPPHICGVLHATLRSTRGMKRGLCQVVQYSVFSILQQIYLRSWWRVDRRARSGFLTATVEHPVVLLWVTNSVKGKNKTESRINHSTATISKAVSKRSLKEVTSYYWLSCQHTVSPIIETGVKIDQKKCCKDKKKIGSFDRGCCLWLQILIEIRQNNWKQVYLKKQQQTNKPKKNINMIDLSGSIC